MSELVAPLPVCRVVHEALRAWAKAHGQDAPPAWAKAPKWMKVSTAESVRFVLDNPNAGAGAQHEQWMAQRLRDGWRHGAVKDADAKTHPMLIPFAELSDFEKRKDDIVIALVRALSDAAPVPAKPTTKAKPRSKPKPKSKTAPKEGAKTAATPKKSKSPAKSAKKKPAKSGK